MKSLMLSTLAVLLCSFAALAQSPINIEEKKVPGGIEFIGHSQSKADIEITFSLEQTRNIKGYSKPVKKLIPAGQTVSILKVKTTPGFSYRYGIQMMQRSSAQPVASSSTRTNHGDQDLEKGIVLFDKTGCGRCTYVGNYLVDHDIPFTVLNISDDANNALMWEKLREQGFKGGRFQTPAIMVDGEISHSHKNLEKFMKNLVK